MASQSPRDGHLDATAGREVVFCHACSNEWYREDHGLMCPYCDSEITEIVSPENDPRHMDDSSGSTSPGLPPLRFADDSDPEEADIEEHMGPHGFNFRRSTRAGPNDTHHDPSIDPVVQRFQDIIHSLGQPPRRAQPISLFGRPENDSFGPPRVHRTTFTSGPFGGGTASVTIFTTPGFVSRGGPSSGGIGGVGGDGDEEPLHRGNIDPFQAIFSNVIRDIGPPDRPGEDSPQLGIARGLREILNLLNTGNTRMGDVVYSQEVYDQILTGLGEMYESSNRPSRVSDEKIAQLQRTTVDEEFLKPGGKECSICLEAMELNDVATNLPCKHWFHDKCVVPWLKVGNTCPVCRTPVEAQEQTQANNGQGSSTGGAAASGSNSNPLHSSTSTPNASFSRHNSDQTRSSGSRPTDGADTPTGRAAADMVSSVSLEPQPRPSNPSQSRLNEALRSVANLQREQNHDRRNRATTSGFSYDTSRLQRRTSHSPPSPRATNLTEQGARMRQRSPSESDRRGNGDREPRRQSGALNWLRERLGGGNGSGSSQGQTRDQQQP